MVIHLDAQEFREARTRLGKGVTTNRRCKLQHTPETHLDIDDPNEVFAGPSFRSFINYLAGRKATQFVKIRREVVQEASPEQFHELISTLAGLDIHSLEVANPRKPTRLSAQVLADFIRRTKHVLKKLIIWGFILISSSSDVSDLSESLRKHPHLHHLGFMQVIISKDGSKPDIFVDPLLIAIASSPCLETLQFAGSFMTLPMREGQSQQRVPHRKAIRDEAQLMKAIVEESTSLHFLALRSLGLTDVGGLALVESLENVSLERKSCPLQYLDLQHNVGLTNATYASLLDALRRNRLLALHGLLVDDYSGADVGTRKEIEFFLRLNSYGRSVLLQSSGSCLQSCIEVLIRARNDIEGLYFLLRQNPSSFFT